LALLTGCVTGTAALPFLPAAAGTAGFFAPACAGAGAGTGTGVTTTLTIGFVPASKQSGLQALVGLELARHGAAAAHTIEHLQDSLLLANQPR
jgi:hypothetical protein